MANWLEQFHEYEKRMEEKKDVRLAMIAEIQTVNRKVTSYLNDPNISEHDKDLQYALDCEMSDPESRIRDLRERRDVLTGKIPYVAYEFQGRIPAPEELAWIDACLSEESMSKYREEYAVYLALREEALARGFVAYGNCRNVR